MAGVGQLRCDYNMALLRVTHYSQLSYWPDNPQRVLGSLAGVQLQWLCDMHMGGWLSEWQATCDLNQMLCRMWLPERMRTC